jgi:magnesium transporter
VRSGAGCKANSLSPKRGYPVPRMEYIRDDLRVGELLAPEFMELLDQSPPRTSEAREAMLNLFEPQLADLLIALPPQQMALAFRLLPRQMAADVFTLLPEDQQQVLLEQMSHEQLAQLFDEMPPDDRAQLFEEMPGQVAARVLSLMNPAERRKTQVILGYPPESVGRIMTPDYVTVRPEWTVQQAMEHIRRYGRDAETINTLYVLNELGILVDDVRLRKLILAAPQQRIEDLMDGQVISLSATEDREAAVQVMSKYDLPVLPVVDSGGILVGIVTFDDVADVAQEETTEDIQKLGAVQVLNEPYVTVPLMELIRKRGGWLTILFLGQMLTIWAMGVFQDEIDAVVVLALFLPLIISSGGNTGSQAATLVVRALAVGDARLRDWWMVLQREIICGIALGAWLGLIVGGRILIWQGLGWEDYSDFYGRVALTIMASVLCVVLWGTIVGSMLPFVLRRAGFDPAASSAPAVATIVDVTGVIIYFTTAVLVLRGTLLP